MDFKDKESMTIILPIKESDYDIFISNKEVGRSVIAGFYELHPELFPKGMSLGWNLNGKDRISKKSGYQLRRIIVIQVAFHFF